MVLFLGYSLPLTSDCLNKNHWGSRLLAGMTIKGKSKKSPGQMSLPWDKQKVHECTQVHEVAEKFIHANGYRASVPGNEIHQILILPCKHELQ